MSKYYPFEMYRPWQPNWDFWLLWIFHRVEIEQLSCATLILRQINAVFTILEVLEFDFCKKFHTWKCQNIPSIKNSELLKWSKWQFLGLENEKWISRNILNFPLCLFPIRLPRSVTPKARKDPIFVVIMSYFICRKIYLNDSLQLDQIQLSRTKCVAIKCTRSHIFITDLGNGWVLKTDMNTGKTRYVQSSQCGNFRIFLSFIFYVKSTFGECWRSKTAIFVISGALDVLKWQILHFYNPQNWFHVKSYW